MVLVNLSLSREVTDLRIANVAKSSVIVSSNLCLGNIYFKGHMSQNIMPLNHRPSQGISSRQEAG
jgi:hypothetical protein